MKNLLQDFFNLILPGHKWTNKQMIFFAFFILFLGVILGASE